MIVLDEHLPGIELPEAIGRWYRGRVCFVTDLRPGSVIKDDAVPGLLLTVDRPTFVTLNWGDFWQHTIPHPGFCLICFTMPSQRAGEIAFLLRRLFRLPAFKTKRARMGKIARVTDENVSFYHVSNRQIRVEPLR
jgi:hypothetical protein